MGGEWQHLQWQERRKGPARYGAKGYLAKLNNLNLKQDWNFEFKFHVLKLMMANINSWHLPSLDFLKSSFKYRIFWYHLVPSCLWTTVSVGPKRDFLAPGPGQNCREKWHLSWFQRNPQTLVARQKYNWSLIPGNNLSNCNDIF